MTLTEDDLARVAGAAAEITRLRAEVERLTKEEDETYELGKRDGYEQAVQDIDVVTGGDGEYCYCTDGDPERHCPTPDAMKAKIADRFSDAERALSTLRDRVREVLRPFAAKLASLEDDGDCPPLPKKGSIEMNIDIAYFRAARTLYQETTDE